MLYLLDTDHLSLLERAGTEANNIKSRLRPLSPDDYGISIITYTEQVKGWLARVARANTPETEVKSFFLLQQNLRFCTGFAIWSYTPEAAALCVAWKEQRVRVATQDMRIAAIAVANDATLLTRNTTRLRPRS